MTVILLYGGMIWYVFPDVDQSISWEGHLAGLITGFVLSLFYKAPEYAKPIVYDWQRPDFDPDSDPFMKHFDENGNFVVFPDEEEEDLGYFLSSHPVNYIVTKKEATEEDGAQ